MLRELGKLQRKTKAVHALVAELGVTESVHSCLHIFRHRPPHQAVGQRLESTSHIVAAGANNHDVKVAGGQVQTCRPNTGFDARHSSLCAPALEVR